MQAGVARGQLDKDTLPIDRCDLDEAEEQVIQQFAQDGCKCDLGPNKSPCCTTIIVDHFRCVRCQMLELTHDELDLVVMGQVMAGCFSRKTPWAAEGQIVHHVLPQWRKNLPKDVPLPPHNGLLVLQGYQGQLLGEWSGC